MYEKSQFVEVVNRFLSFHEKPHRLSEQSMNEKIITMDVSELEILQLTAKIFEEVFGPVAKKDIFSVKSKIFENSTYLQWYEAIVHELNEEQPREASNVVDLQSYIKRNQQQEQSPEYAQTPASGFFIPDTIAIKIESLPDSKKQRNFLKSLMKVLEFPSADEEVLKEQLKRAFNALT